MRRIKRDKVLKDFEKYIRKTYGTVGEAAAALGMSKAYIYYMFQGQRPIPDKLLKRIRVERKQETVYYRRTNDYTN